jgi:chlorite dismutase
MTSTPDAAHGYTLWAVFSHEGETSARTASAAPFDHAVAELVHDGVVLRGIYDVSGMREDGDLMLWLHGPVLEDLQRGLRALRRTSLLAGLERTWSAVGVHRPAEFSANHVPAFLRNTQPLAWLTVYPFVRSYDWYLLPPEERGAMLREHGLKARDYPGVQANTVASFALGDYEWLLAFEAADPTELVDLMRHLRNTEARRHVREEIPFFTGRRITAAEAVEVLS